MPISDAALRKEKNNFIAVKGETTVGQAIAALQDLGGRPWWHLVVRLPDGSWGVTRFSRLYSSLSPMAEGTDVSLRECQELTIASAVERDSMDTKAAQALARKSPGKFMLVTVDGLPVGILVEGVTRGAGVMAVPSANLGDLGGKYIKLKDYSSILLGSSKSGVRTAKPSPPEST
jgi:hypothetical protein